MDKMSELVKGTSGEFRIEKRPGWYQVNAFLLELGQAAASLELEPKDLVHLGGTANFYRFYQAYGPRAVMFFRGTHDMDVVSFNQGALGRLLNLLKLQHAEESDRLVKKNNRYKSQSEKTLSDFDVYHGATRLHRVSEFSTRRALGLPDKKSVYIALDYSDIPGVDSGFEVDLYESSTNDIRFNNRLLKADHIILDPPEKLILPTNNPRKTRGIVAVPSLRDYFIIKTDIIDFSRSGLRPKDEFDILTTLQLASEIGVPFVELLDGLHQANNTEDYKKRLSALVSLFLNPKKNLQTIPEDYPFLPNPQLVVSALNLTKQHQ